MTSPKKSVNKKTPLIKRGTLIFFGLFIAFTVWGYFNIWRSPKYYLQKKTCQEVSGILTMQQYGKVADTHARPYLVQTPQLLVYGSAHIKDPTHKQNAHIEKVWNEFKPTVLLVEGRLGFLIPYAMNPVKRFGEMGKAAALAKKAGIPIYSWELPPSEITQALTKKFSKEQIILMEILRPYFGNLRHGKPDSPNAFVEGYLHRASLLGLESQFGSVKAIDKIWKRDFPQEKDWRDTSDQWGLPGYLSKIGDYSNYLRNQHLVCVIKQLLAKKERVFVIAGSSHAVCIAKAFK